MFKDRKEKKRLAFKIGFQAALLKEAGQKALREVKKKETYPEKDEKGERQ